ncbi:MAG: hypothetical protein IPK12_11200 [Gemmatimonadetes bacterium]|nr:hypothetical protein [Gemmatimonadota bacterium]
MALSRLRMTRLVPLAVALLPLAPLTAQEPNFGTAAAVAGREVFIGQPANQYATGFVYQFKPDARGAWREAGRLAGPDSTRFNGFGRRIAVDGNTLLVSESPSDSSAPGRVHVYERATATAGWRYVTTLNPQGAVNGDRVGRTLALVGDVAAIGATRSDSMLGAVFVFRRSNGTWSQEAKLRPAGLKPATGFGAALALQKDLVLVGALQADSNAGAAYIFRRDADGSWKQEGGALQLPIGGGQGAPGAQRANAQFGASVLLHEGAAYIGAPGFAQGQGRVARFTYDSAQKRWNQGGSLFPFVSTPNTQFGGALASAGKDVVVGPRGPTSSGARCSASRSTRPAWRPPSPGWSTTAPRSRAASAAPSPRAPTSWWRAWGTPTSARSAPSSWRGARPGAPPRARSAARSSAPPPSPARKPSAPTGRWASSTAARPTCWPWCPPPRWAAAPRA